MGEKHPAEESGYLIAYWPHLKVCASCPMEVALFCSEAMLTAVPLEQLSLRCTVV